MVLAIDGEDDHGNESQDNGGDDTAGSLGGHTVEFGSPIRPLPPVRVSHSSTSDEEKQSRMGRFYDILRDLDHVISNASLGELEEMSKQVTATIRSHQDRHKKKRTTSLEAVQIKAPKRQRGPHVSTVNPKQEFTKLGKPGRKKKPGELSTIPSQETSLFIQQLRQQ